MTKACLSPFLERGACVPSDPVPQVELGSPWVQLRRQQQRKNLFSDYSVGCRRVS